MDSEQKMQVPNRRPDICPYCGINSDYQTSCCGRVEVLLRIARAAQELVRHNSVIPPYVTEELKEVLSILPEAGE